MDDATLSDLLQIAKSFQTYLVRYVRAMLNYISLALWGIMGLFRPHFRPFVSAPPHSPTKAESLTISTRDH